MAQSVPNPHIRSTPAARRDWTSGTPRQSPLQVRTAVVLHASTRHRQTVSPYGHLSLATALVLALCPLLVVPLRRDPRAPLSLRISLLATSRANRPEARLRQRRSRQLDPCLRSSSPSLRRHHPRGPRPSKKWVCPQRRTTAIAYVFKLPLVPAPFSWAFLILHCLYFMS